MKIISKYKDYYDHLTGIYGVDEKIVLDRREFDIIPEFLQNTILLVAFCGELYTGVCDSNGTFYWGDDLYKLQAPVKEISNKTKKFLSRYDDTDSKSKINIIIGKNTEVVNTKPETTIVNEKYKCPIILKIYRCNEKNIHNQYRYGMKLIGDNHIKYPKLSSIDFGKALNPHDAFVKLSAFLAPKDNISDTMTDKQKIVARGFDLKTSFRKM